MIASAHFLTYLLHYFAARELWQAIGHQGAGVGRLAAGVVAGFVVVRLALGLGRWWRGRQARRARRERGRRAVENERLLRELVREQRERRR